jgi:hypothetical protein
VSERRAGKKEAKSGSTWLFFPPLLVFIPKLIVLISSLVVRRNRRYIYWLYWIYKTRRILQVIYKNTTRNFCPCPCVQSLSTKEMGNADEDPGDASNEGDAVLLCVE